MSALQTAPDSASAYARRDIRSSGAAASPTSRSSKSDPFSRPGQDYSRRKHRREAVSEAGRAEARTDRGRVAQGPAAGSGSAVRSAATSCLSTTAEKYSHSLCRCRAHGRKLKHAGDALSRGASSSPPSRKTTLFALAHHIDSVLLYVFSFWCDDTANKNCNVQQWASVYGLVSFVKKQALQEKIPVVLGLWCVLGVRAKTRGLELTLSLTRQLPRGGDCRLYHGDARAKGAAPQSLATLARVPGPGTLTNAPSTSSTAFAIWSAPTTAAARWGRQGRSGFFRGSERGGRFARLSRRQHRILLHRIACRPSAASTAAAATSCSTGPASLEQRRRGRAAGVCQSLAGAVPFPAAVRLVLLDFVAGPDGRVLPPDLAPVYLPGGGGEGSTPVGGGVCRAGQAVVLRVAVRVGTRDARASDRVGEGVVGGVG